jgi:hypothetical protein
LKSNLELTKPCILIHCFLLDMPYWLLIVGWFDIIIFIQALLDC